VPWWKAASTHQEPAAPGTEAFQEEASSLAEAIDTVAHTVRAIADRRLPVGGQSDWTPARGRLSEVDGLRLAYRLTLAWHRFQAGCTNEPLENVVRLNMIARLTKARSRDDHRARSNRSRSGPHRTPYEAAVHDLEVAKWDIATCLKHLEAGLERPFWELYRNLAFRTPDELFDLEGTDPAILQRVFRPLNQAAEGTPAQTVEEPVLSVATVNP
jgi:hypothetical protein